MEQKESGRFYEIFFIFAGLKEIFRKLGIILIGILKYQKFEKEKKIILNSKRFLNIFQ